MPPARQSCSSRSEEEWICGSSSDTSVGNKAGRLFGFGFGAGNLRANKESVLTSHGDVRAADVQFAHHQIFLPTHGRHGADELNRRAGVQGFLYFFAQIR